MFAPKHLLINPLEITFVITCDDVCRRDACLVSPPRIIGKHTARQKYAVLQVPRQSGLHHYSAPVRFIDYDYTEI
jgi:hypothetical protein